jgi:Na+(H+)/acetate symporter ActP
MVFVFYQFETAPLNFNPAAQNAVYESEYKSDYQDLEKELQTIHLQKKSIASQFGAISETNQFEVEQLQTEVALLNKKEFAIRDEAKALIKQADDTVETNDKDYIFISFILDFLPKGLVGLLLAVILSAAMSSTASELNALASTTTMDLFKRNIKTEKSDRYFLNASKLFTLGWGIFAIGFACIAYLSDNLIQLVNIIGSIFYGNVLGVFLLAFFIKYVKAQSVFIGALITQLIVLLVWYIDLMPYLWLNVFGSILVISISLFLEFIQRNKA